MADISITDQVSLSAAVKLSDDAPLALAKLKTLNFSNLPVVGDFNKPIDQFPLDEVDVGLNLTSPNALLGDDSKFSISGGVSASFSICNHKSETLFDDDQFSPRIEIKPDECWAGLCIDVDLKESINTSVTGGFGVNVGVGEGISLGTFIHFPVAGSSLPNLKDGLTAVLQNYSVPNTPEKIRTTPIGIAHTAETSGSISFGASYSAPLNVNPLAVLGLPLNLSLNIAPAVNATVEGSIKLDGSFIVRTYRTSATKLVFGAYKKRKTALTASLTEKAGIGIDINTTDVLSKVLNAVIPAADLDNLHLDDSQRDELRGALKECVDQSISLAMNASCTASVADESAVVYELDLSGTDMSQTDAAISSALHGDWSRFETLSNARPLRNIVRELHNRKHKLSINLLGLYNATSITDYLKSTTILHDEHGQIALIDKAAAKGLSAGTTPYAAKSDKLRSVLAHAFVATVTYGASKGKLAVNAFTVRQSLLEYHANAGASDITPQVLVSRAVGLALKPEWDSILTASGAFNQNKFFLDIAYDASSVLHLFYENVASRTPYTSDSLDRIGRDTKLALLLPTAVNSMQRRIALSSDSIWAAMKTSGNTSTFSQIPGLAKLDPTARAAISVDFLDIRWWSDALLTLAPKLTAVLAAIDQATSPNPLADQTFMAAHKKLEDALASLTSRTQSAFNDGWPLAVMYRLATSAASVSPSVQMDIGWNGQFEHYESGAKLAVGQSGGS